jgi:carboxypeptidase family protein
MGVSAVRSTSSSQVRSRVLAVVVLMAVLAGCDKESPTETARPEPLPDLLFFCLPLDVRLTCTAIANNVPGRGQVDVTKTATYLVSDPSVGGFLEPGIFTPRRRGEVKLSARYEALTPRFTPEFLVDPSQPPRSFSSLAGKVRDADTNMELPGATVEILDGYAQGSMSVANEIGFYLIDKVLTEETFSVRASLPGYAPSTVSYRVDPSTYRTDPSDTTPRNPPYLEIQLRRSE